MKKFFLIALVTFCFQGFSQTPVASSDFQLFGDHVFIKLSVDGSEPLDFILDTGDGLTVIDIDVAKKLNLPMDHKLSATSAQGSITGAYIKHNSIKLEGVLLESNIKVYATSLGHLEISIGKNIDGIIGYDLLVHHVARLNYTDMKLELYDSGNYSTKGVKIPFKLYNFIPTISASTTLNSGEMLTGTYFINTGAGTSVDFNTPYAKANNIIEKTGQHYSYPVKGLEEMETRHYEGRVKSFEFGTFSIENMPVGISQVESGIQGDKKTAGIIGNRVLSKYNILFDYKTSVMYFEENSKAGSPIEVNCSGVDLQLNKEMTKALVHQVFEKTQAESAGIKVGDEVVSINGKKLGEISLVEMEAILKKSGTSATLVIAQGGASKEITLDLKELL